MPQESVIGKQNVATLERWASIGVGGLMITRAFTNRSFFNALGGLLGAALIKRGVTGHCEFYGALGVTTSQATKSGADVKPSAPLVRRSITIGKNPEELFAFWRNPNNLARIMAHFAEITPKSEDLTHWRVRGRAGQIFEWDSQQSEDEANKKITWQTLPGTQLPNRGEVTFRQGPEGVGTVVTLQMQFEPPLGPVGSQLAKLFHRGPMVVTDKSLRRFKSLTETGEIPTLDKNPSGRGDSDVF